MFGDINKTSNFKSAEIWTMFLFLCTQLFQKRGHYSREDIIEGVNYLGKYITICNLTIFLYLLLLVQFLFLFGPDLLALGLFFLEPLQFFFLLFPLFAPFIDIVPQLFVEFTLLFLGLEASSPTPKNDLKSIFKSWNSDSLSLFLEWLLYDSSDVMRSWMSNWKCWS